MNWKRLFESEPPIVSMRDVEKAAEGIDLFVQTEELFMARKVLKDVRKLIHLFEVQCQVVKAQAIEIKEQRKRIQDLQRRLENAPKNQTTSEQREQRGEGFGQILGWKTTTTIQ